MWKIYLADEAGNLVKVEDGGLLISVLSGPPLLPQKCRVYSRFLTSDGLTAGTFHMGQDGSGTAIDYWIPADGDNDIYITKLSFMVGYGSAADLYEFADAGAPLANGILTKYQDTHGDEVTIAAFKSNGEFQRYTNAPIPDVNWESRGFAGAGDYGSMPT